MNSPNWLYFRGCVKGHMATAGLRGNHPPVLQAPVQGDRHDSVGEIECLLDPVTVVDVDKPVDVRTWGPSIPSGWPTWARRPSSRNCSARRNLLASACRFLTKQNWLTLGLRYLVQLRLYLLGLPRSDLQMRVMRCRSNSFPAVDVLDGLESSLKMTSLTSMGRFLRCARYIFLAHCTYTLRSMAWTLA